MDAIAVADTYYEAFRRKTDFQEVPIADDLAFHGPSGPIEGADAFRAAVSGIAKGLAKLEIRHQLERDGTVVSLYDFDLGAPDGPIPMAEVLEIAGDEIRRIELIFDTRRLPGV